MTGRDAELEVEVFDTERPTDKFVQVTNALARGEGEYAEWDPLDRLYLIAGLSCRTGYKTTLKKMESWLPGVGRDRQEGVRRRLRERGYLSMTRRFATSGTSVGGQFVGWKVSFHWEALPVEQRDSLQSKKPKAAAPTAAGQSMPGISGHGGSDDDGAGRTMPGSSGHGSSGHGSSGPEDQGVGPYIEKTNKENPPTPTPSSTDAGSDGGRGEGLPADDPNLPSLRRAVAFVMAQPDVQALAAQYPNWRTPIVSKTLTEALNRGLGDLEKCSKTLVAIASGRYGRSYSAALMLESGDWWASERPAPVEGRNAERCRIHPHSPAVSCPPCASVRKGRPEDDEEPPAAEVPLQRSEAVEAARAVARRAASRSLAEAAGLRV